MVCNASDPVFESTPEQEIFFSRVSFPGKSKFQKIADSAPFVHARGVISPRA